MKIKLRGKKWKQITRQEWKKLLDEEKSTAHFIENKNDETTYFKQIEDDTNVVKGEKKSKIE